MQHLTLILTLTSGLAAALLFGYLTQRLGLSPIAGYLLAGLLVGPHTPGFIADQAVAEQLAHVGVILLMFGVGLQFHVEDLLAVRRVAVPGAIAAGAVAAGLGATIALGFGWPGPARLVYGLALAVASTVVLVRVLSDHRDLHTQTGHIAVGWLVVEDVITVVALVLLPALFAPPGEAAPGILMSIVRTLLEIAGVVIFTVLVGKRLIPGLLHRVAATGSRELFTLSVLVVALGIAVGAAALFGVSVALGAFLAGLVVGRSEFSLRAASDALPMRQAFAVLFFVSVGMLLDPRIVLDRPGLVAATLAVVMVGKPLMALLLVRLLRYPFRVALAVAVALAQIGEFSFILASLGTELGILGSEATQALILVSIVTIVLNPLLYGAVPRVARWVKRHRVLGGILDAPFPDEGAADVPRQDADPRLRAVVVGYGPTGRTITRLLRDNGIEAVVIEMNIDTVRELRKEGITAVYGDAAREETLASAGISRAAGLLLTSAGMVGSREVIRIAKALNPGIHVVARAMYLRDLRPLRASGADSVFTGEGEVAMAFTEELLVRLGATPEQIERERERARSELFGEELEEARTTPGRLSV